MSEELAIVGAGLAGLIAAHAWPQAQVYEASYKPKAEHKALLRFRSDAVAKLTGMDFRRVTVRKAVWDGGFIQPTVRAANLYAQKVTGALTGDRSIWNLQPVERFIAPENFYDELIANVGARIHWGWEFDFETWSRNPDRGPLINTAPLPVVLGRLYGNAISAEGFNRAPIAVHRFRIEEADVFQTIYFPAPELQVYRASITGSLLIVECMKRPIGALDDNLGIVLEAFGIDCDIVKHIDSVEQKYGKIVPLADAHRKALLHRLTKEHGLFSLGRFATWRNVLLDDVVQDIAVLRRLLKADHYERAIHAA